MKTSPVVMIGAMKRTKSGPFARSKRNTGHFSYANSKTINRAADVALERLRGRAGL